MAHVTDYSTGGTFLTARISAMRTKMSVWSAQNRIYRQTYSELNALTDRDLSDMGIARGQIEIIAREAAHK